MGNRPGDWSTPEMLERAALVFDGQAALAVGTARAAHQETAAALRERAAVLENPAIALPQLIREALGAKMTEGERRKLSGVLQAAALLAQQEADAADRARRKRPGARTRPDCECSPQMSVQDPMCPAPRLAPACEAAPEAMMMALGKAAARAGMQLELGPETVPAVSDFCKLFPDCQHTPGPSGYCACHDGGAAPGACAHTAIDEQGRCHRCGAQVVIG